MVKKFKDFISEDFDVELPSFSEPKSKIEERFNIQTGVFKEAIAKLNTIMDEHYSEFKDSMHWGDIGSLHNINENLINIIEGWDEELAIKLKNIINSKS